MPINLDFGESEDISFAPVPEGVYEVAVSDANLVPTKDGTGQLIKLQLRVVDGDQQNKVVFDQWYIPNKVKQTPDAYKTTLNFFRAHLEAVTGQKWDQNGMQLDVKDLPGNVVRITVFHETYEGKIQAKVKNYMPALGVSNNQAANVLPTF